MEKAKIISKKGIKSKKKATRIVFQKGKSAKIKRIAALIIITAIVVIFFLFTGNNSVDKENIVSPVFADIKILSPYEIMERRFEILGVEQKEDLLNKNEKKSENVIFYNHNSDFASYSSIPYVSRGKRGKYPVTATKEYLYFECQNTKKIIKSDILLEAGKKAISEYFGRHNLPLYGYGEEFIRISQELRLDWRLLPAIAMIESTGGKYLFRPYNPFGWGRASFSCFTEAIETVGKNLAGLNPNTAGFYANRTIWQKLRVYNSVVEEYPEMVKRVMRTIEKIAQNNENNN